MKELSIEEKAKAYDKAIENMRKFRDALSNHEETDLWVLKKEIVTDIEYYFPEIKESEDEKIRKAILALVKQSSEVLDKQNQNNMITWLENQAEQKSIWHNEDEEPKRGSLILLIMQSGTPIVAKIIEPKHIFNHGERWAYIDDLLEKQGEHKLADKIEPKFNFSVGQWIVATGKCVYLITKIDGFNVTLVDVDGNEYVFDTSSLEDAHLWTIQDAKDGDVLFHSDSASNGIFIFKEILQRGTIQKVLCYCDYDSEDGFCLGEKHTCCWANSKILRPATKEQRDTLMKAMADAGYTFNFESKELRKIEKPIEWSYEDEANLNNIIWLCNNCIKGTETTWIPSQATKIKHLIETIKEEGLAQQNPAWSEEDEQIILSIEQAMNCASLLNIVPEKMDKIRTWLKSLKDRVDCEAKK